jgi:hypothetical protein
MRSILAIGTLVLLLVSLRNGIGQSPPHGNGTGEISVFLPAQITWNDGPPSLLPGAKVAVLEGDPNKEGPFVMRLRLPDGFRVAPHTHPKPERVTVIAGTLNIGMGARFDAEACRAMPAGSFGTWPAGMKHFAWFKGETILQLHGTGPWLINYRNPADDPRNAKKK